MSADLLYDDVEESLRASVDRLIASRVTAESVARCYEGGAGVHPVWEPLVSQVGVAALLAPDEAGGSGASAREAGVVAEALGRGLAPVPFLTSAVMATASLVHAGDTATVASLTDGSRTAVLAVPFSTAPGEVPIGVVRRSDGRLDGTVTSVADAPLAEAFVVPARGDDGVLGLHVVDRADLDVTAVTSFDMTRPLGDLALQTVGAPAVATGEAAVRALRSGLDHGAAVLASEQLGVAQWCLDTTLAYVRSRHQFGRAIGSYQAIKHRLADLWVLIVHATAAARYAVDCLASGSPDLPVAVSLAQAHCSEVAVRAAEEGIQLHGGVGMTWEHPAHLYLKRAKADQTALGSPGWHRAHLAELVDLRHA